MFFKFTFDASFGCFLEFFLIQLETGDFTVIRHLLVYLVNVGLHQLLDFGMLYTCLIYLLPIGIDEGD